MGAGRRPDRPLRHPADLIILLAVLALVVVKALAGSPWGTFTVATTIPIALLMGVYSRFLRPGRIGEMSAIGVVLLLGALIYGQTVSERPTLARRSSPSTATTLALILIGYGFVASVLPVWLLLAPRDYLSTFLKIGTIIAAGHRHRHRQPESEDAGGDPLHRRQRTGLRRAACSRSCSSPSPAARFPASTR